MERNIRMKEARLAKGLSQDELAKRAGISRQTVNMIERGDFNPSIALALHICWILDKTLDELFWKDKEGDS